MVRNKLLFWCGVNLTTPMKSKININKEKLPCSKNVRKTVHFMYHGILNANEYSGFENLFHFARLNVIRGGGEDISLKWGRKVKPCPHRIFRV